VLPANPWISRCRGRASLLAVDPNAEELVERCSRVARVTPGELLVDRLEDIVARLDEHRFELGGIAGLCLGDPFPPSFGRFADGLVIAVPGDRFQTVDECLPLSDRHLALETEFAGEIGQRARHRTDLSVDEFVVNLRPDILLQER